MTITTRLTCFFLALLLLVLLGFSIATYFVADHYLQQQVEERLAAAMNSICGVIETNTDGVEWEPGERRQVLEFSAFEDQLVWWVTDEQGQIVAQSVNPFTSAPSGERDVTARLQAGDQLGNTWLIGQRTIETVPSTNRTSDRERSSSQQEPGKHAALNVTAAILLVPVQATRYQLAGWLGGLSALVWLVSLVAGRFVCRWALAPVRRIADAAEQVQPEDLSERLPPLATHDELAQLTNAFNAMLDRLQQSFERQRRFTSDASHQLRTPLTAILGHVEVSLRRERTDSDYRSVLETVRKKATHLSRVVESLLFLARNDQEANLPSLELLELRDWLPRYVESWSDHVRFNDIALTNETSAIGLVSAQPALLAELLNILLDNACKFSQPGTPIDVSLREDEGRVAIRVQDHGCGIATNELADLFTPFIRSTEARRIGVDGIGLGLSIAQRLARLFAGDLSVTSQAGQGSCFVLWLPQQVAEHGAK
ncbi:ATP-binding protein [Blastopirellula marina]|uniref:histidine kinase n=1 Tax=Blastopirellula marina TaxID=124 RepID=A0A2S8GCF5_9BACT|nr:ATP-binding protein [Blastopirellula marina]PQO41941.1 histidine kinase [Blastopirellula marina]PTL46299.1 HAMP domain-containing protein [Blastopirellula marina]